jgi:hypothetical protein
MLRKAQLVVGGVLPAVVALLQGGSDPEVREHLAGVVRSLAYDEELQQQVASTAGLLPQLVALLEPCNATPAAQEQAAAALANLCTKDDRLRAKVAASGAIGPLVQALAPGQADAVQQQAAKALWGILMCQDSSEWEVQVASAPGALESLVALLAPDRSAACHMPAAACLSSICRSSDELRVQVATTPGALPALAQLLVRSSSAAAKDVASGCLENISAGGHALQEISADAVCGHVVPLLEGKNSPAVQEQAVQLLWDLTHTAGTAGLHQAIRRRIAGSKRAVVALASAAQRQGVSQQSRGLAMHLVSECQREGSGGGVSSSSGSGGGLLMFTR